MYVPTSPDSHDLTLLVYTYLDYWKIDVFRYRAIILDNITLTGENTEYVMDKASYDINKTKKYWKMITWIASRDAPECE